jgi:hypothetical protein
MLGNVNGNSTLYYYTILPKKLLMGKQKVVNVLAIFLHN